MPASKGGWSQLDTSLLVFHAHVCWLLHSPFPLPNGHVGDADPGCLTSCGAQRRTPHHPRPLQASRCRCSTRQSCAVPACACGAWTLSATTRWVRRWAGYRSPGRGVAAGCLQAVLMSSSPPASEFCLFACTSLWANTACSALSCPWPFPPWCSQKRPVHDLRQVCWPAAHAPSATPAWFRPTPERLACPPCHPGLSAENLYSTVSVPQLQGVRPHRPAGLGPRPHQPVWRRLGRPDAQVPGRQGGGARRRSPAGSSLLVWA